MSLRGRMTLTSLSRSDNIIVHMILRLGVCILLRVLDQVQGFPSNATLFQ
jgi:hypothetical protein